MTLPQQIAFSTLADMARGLQEREYSSVELTKAFLGRIARFNSALNAYVSIHEEAALLQAEAADLQRRSGIPLAPLHGLPIAVKDLCDIRGQVTTAGSKAWLSRRSTVTSTVVERLLAAGMIILGKTHMVEFAFGSWGSNPLMGTPRNPWDMRGRHRAPGGSSSGSGVAVAAGLAPAAIGSDTGGSIRAPAAFNGLTGLKTTSGLVSLYGTVPLSPSLDTIGPMTRTAEDAALLLAALAGPDPRDPGTLAHPAFFQPPSGEPLQARHLRIAVMRPEQYPWEVTADVQAATDNAVRALQSLGATVEQVDVPFDFADLMRRNGTLIAAEAHHVHAGYIDDMDLPIGPWVRQRILGGKAVDATAYQAILAHREQTIASFSRWMQPYDALLTPTLPFVACPVEDIDENVTPLGAFNRAINYVDTCAISLPAGFSADGLPIGVQLVGKQWQEGLLLQLGAAFQQVTDWHRRTPPELG
ncbi:amidase [Noviherbaspirillum galbum]|uniref:Amidase n=1 Tax=Noviherbaspirillum galbum TaxID=2709383 RepID=A0A6B3SR45_9BURK|nr:amidase [Noviherbaspirillum galbum]NEX62988.1 amidase [Noviherbaspirillum galbum]